jgi:glutamine synthetase adenylyltransferase
MKQSTIDKVVAEEEREEFLGLVNSNLDATFKNLQFLSRTSGLPNDHAQILLVRQFMKFSAEIAAEEGMDADEFLVHMTEMFEEVLDEEEEEESLESAVEAAIRVHAGPRTGIPEDAPTSVGLPDDE